VGKKAWEKEFGSAGNHSVCVGIGEYFHWFALVEPGGNIDEQLVDLHPHSDGTDPIFWWYLFQSLF
jgi:hypothetical protein